MITQFALGIYLKLHIHEKTIRPYVVPFHGVIGKIWPVLGWCQVRPLFLFYLVPSKCAERRTAFSQLDAFWCHNDARLLYGRRNPSMSRSLYHGVGLHRLRDPPRSCDVCRRSLAKADRPQPGMVRQLGHFPLGDRQYFHGAPWIAHEMVSQGPSTYVSPRVLTLYVRSND